MSGAEPAEVTVPEFLENLAFCCDCSPPSLTNPLVKVTLGNKCCSPDAQSPLKQGFKLCI